MLAVVPICEACQESLGDWHGNVLVESADYFHKESRHIDDIVIWCKRCTKELDPRPYPKLHNLMELRWLRDEPHIQLASIMLQLRAGTVRWADRPLRKLIELCLWGAGWDTRPTWDANEAWHLK